MTGDWQADNQTVRGKPDERERGRVRGRGGYYDGGQIALAYWCAPTFLSNRDLNGAKLRITVWLCTIFTNPGQLNKAEKLGNIKY